MPTRLLCGNRWPFEGLYRPVVRKAFGLTSEGDASRTGQRCGQAVYSVRDIQSRTPNVRPGVDAACEILMRSCITQHGSNVGGELPIRAYTPSRDQSRQLNFEYEPIVDVP